MSEEVEESVEETPEDSDPKGETGKIPIEELHLEDLRLVRSNQRNRLTEKLNDSTIYRIK